MAPIYKRNQCSSIHITFPKCLDKCDNTAFIMLQNKICICLKAHISSCSSRFKLLTSLNCNMEAFAPHTYTVKLYNGLSLQTLRSVTSVIRFKHQFATQLWPVLMSRLVYMNTWATIIYFYWHWFKEAVRCKD